VPVAALSGLGQFSEPALLILVSLLEGDKHGTAIVQDIERFAGRRLGPGTLYGAIARLERLRLIEALPGVGRRKPYHLTQAGLTEVRHALDQMAALAGHGQRRLRQLGAAQA
jgi:DNA-binding PadR family transcriptional regulator